MSLIALFSDKGSPGATTLGLALAAVWPRPVALVECDLAGGDLALRLLSDDGRPALRPDPGLLTLAAAARRDAAASEATAFAHGQQLPGFGTPGPVVVLGATSPEQASGLAGLWPAIAKALSQEPNGDVLADLGRLHPGSPAVAVAAAADLLIGVSRDRAADMLRMRDRIGHVLASLPPTQRQPQARIVLVAGDRHGYESADAMRTVLEHAALPVDVAGFLAVDTNAVSALQQGRTGGWGLSRTLLLRSAKALAREFCPANPAQSSAAEPKRTTRRLAVLGRSR